MFDQSFLRLIDEKCRSMTAPVVISMIENLFVSIDCRVVKTAKLKQTSEKKSFV